jgi:hypothetical protein
MPEIDIVQESISFSFSYDASNPRVGDRVMLCESLCPRMSWSNNRFGNEYVIKSVAMDGDIHIWSPFDSYASGYIWHAEWLMPAPANIPNGTRVLCARFNEMAGSMFMFRDRLNYNDSMIASVARQMESPLIVRNSSDLSSDYYHLSNEAWCWDRDWLFITNISIQQTGRQPMIGDMVMITHGKLNGVKKRVVRTMWREHGSAVYVSPTQRYNFPEHCKLIQPKQQKA